MGELFVYILKSSLCLAAFYLFYKLMLSKETFHKFNRIVLIALFVFSFIIPFIQISLNKETPYTGVNLNLEALLAMAQLSTDTASQETAQNRNYWIMLLFVVYVFGVAIAFLKASLSFAKMFSLIRAKDSERINLEKNIVLVIHKKTIAPFSWMKYIVVSDLDYQESGREIISHEMAHISRMHSIDLLIAEVVKIVNWFNPAVYLLKQELQNIHEYQADEAVINKGIDAKQYQLLLIKKAVGARLYTIANSFNHSKLKNRITMISKKKSTKVAALKALFVLPLTAFAIVAFASHEVTSKMEVISSTKITDFIQKDTIKKEVKTFVVTDKNKEKKVFIIKKDSVINYSEDGAVRIRISGTTTYIGDSLKYVKVDDNKKPLVFINDLEVDSDLIKILDTKKIKTVVVHKGDNAIEKYGPKAKNGVIIVTTKVNYNSKDNSCEDVVVIGYGNSRQNPLYVVDGVVQKDSLCLKTINPQSINALVILKDDTAVKKYGEKGKNGVIEITLKKDEKTVKQEGQTQKSETKIIIRGGNISKSNLLYVVDGKVMGTDFKLDSINPETIDSITILKESATVKQYGERGKDGVIQITLKKK